MLQAALYTAGWLAAGLAAGVVLGATVVASFAKFGPWGAPIIIVAFGLAGSAIFFLAWVKTVAAVGGFLTGAYYVTFIFIEVQLAGLERPNKWHSRNEES